MGTEKTDSKDTRPNDDPGLPATLVLLSTRVCRDASVIVIYEVLMSAGNHVHLLSLFLARATRRGALFTVQPGNSRSCVCGGRDHRSKTVVLSWAEERIRGLENTTGSWESFRKGSRVPFGLKDDFTAHHAFGCKPKFISEFKL